MREIKEDPAREEVWVAMADHFLDTETRHDIPLTAMRCVEVGLSVSGARKIWCYEVSRAVGFNAWGVAGEWAGWDRDWLIQRIERLRSRWDNAPGTARWLRYRFRVHLMHRIWIAIGRCMKVIQSFHKPGDQKQVSIELASLARHLFDFSPDDYGALRGEEAARLSELYPEPFWYALEPALAPGEAALAHRRVQTALARSVQEKRILVGKRAPLEAKRIFCAKEDPSR